MSGTGGSVHAGLIVLQAAPEVLDRLLEVAEVRAMEPIRLQADLVAVEEGRRAQVEAALRQAELFARPVVAE